MSKFAAISWWEQVICDDMIMISILYKTNKLSSSFTVLVYWNNSQQVDILLHSDALSDSELNSRCSISLRLVYKLDIPLCDLVNTGGVAKLGSDLPALLTALTRNMYSLFSWSPSTVPVLLSPFTSVPYN